MLVVSLRLSDRSGPKVEAVRATATLKPSAASAVWQALVISYDKL